jgi:hypothetical protein
MKYRKLLLVLLLFTACKPDRKVSTSFYYWKTIYKNNATESSYLTRLHTHKLYVRIMDVDMDDDGITPVPVSPIVFKDKLPAGLQIVPVVFIVNDILKTTTKPQLDVLARKLLIYVNAKTAQAGKTNYPELQIDCDWTAATRYNYFYLLRQIRQQPALKGITLSATLRLHQLKNQKSSGVPPVDKAMLMCYNMGDLRKYGPQNSILDINELKKYLGDNVAVYPMPMDVGLPLFKWAVAFRNKQYAGISKRIKFADLGNKNQFIFMGNNLYKAVTDLPQYGLIKDDEIRWEAVSLADLESVSKYISPFIKTRNLDVIYFHLDEETVNTYTYESLEKITDLLR